MSRKNLVSALALSAALPAAVCWFVSGTRLAAAPQALDGAGVSVGLNGARLLHRSQVTYPAEAAAKGIQGDVTVEVRVDANGEVSDVSVVSGPEELRKAVIQSVLDWHFMKDSAGATHQINVDFTLAPGQPIPRMSALAPPAAPPGQRKLKDILVTGVSEAARTELLALLPVHAGDTVDAEQYDRILGAVRGFDRHLSVNFTPTVSGDSLLRIFPITPTGVAWIPGGVPGGVVGGILAAPPPPPPAPAPAPPPPPGPPPERIKVGGQVQEQMLVKRTPPVYPALAKQARIQGVVRLNAVIGRDGRVILLDVVSGHPLLTPAALDAARNWVYKPMLLNGRPVEVSTTIDVNFTLSQ